MVLIFGDPQSRAHFVEVKKYLSRMLQEVFAQQNDESDAENLHIDGDN